MKVYAARQAQEFPDTHTGRSISLVPLHQQMAGKSRTALRLLFAAVGLLLLIACVNVANLLLARGVARQRELAIRAALGAAARVCGAVLAENLLLAVLGGALGLLFAAWCLAGCIAQPGQSTAFGKRVAQYPPFFSSRY